MYVVGKRIQGGQCRGQYSRWNRALEAIEQSRGFLLQCRSIKESRPLKQLQKREMASKLVAGSHEGYSDVWRLRGPPATDSKCLKLQGKIGRRTKKDR